MGLASPLIALGLAVAQITLGLSIPLIALGSLWLGVEFGAGVDRSKLVQVLRVCLPFLLLVVLWQLARFASNTNDQGGDMTDQIVIKMLAVVYVVMYGFAALGGRIYRLAVGRRATVEPTGTISVAGGFGNRPAVRLAPTVASPGSRRGSRFWKVAGLSLAASVLALVALGCVKLVQTGNYNNRPYPHPIPTSGSDEAGGVDYGPGVAGAAVAARVPLLWFGPKAFGLPLADIMLTERDGPSFPPSVNVHYGGSDGTFQITQSLVAYRGEDEQFMLGPSITLHGATFYFANGFREGDAIGLINGHEVSLHDLAGSRAGWLRVLRSLRWACAPARPHCSGW
jgi:hypothetical protein